MSLCRTQDICLMQIPALAYFILDNAFCFVYFFFRFWRENFTRATLPSMRKMPGTFAKTNTYEFISQIDDTTIQIGCVIHNNRRILRNAQIEIRL